MPRTRSGDKTVKQLLKTLHGLKRTAVSELAAHQKEWGRCLGSCVEAAEYRARIGAFDAIIKHLGGRP